MAEYSVGQAISVAVQGRKMKAYLITDTEFDNLASVNDRISRHWSFGWSCLAAALTCIASRLTVNGDLSAYQIAVFYLFPILLVSFGVRELFSLHKEQTAKDSMVAKVKSESGIETELELAQAATPLSNKSLSELMAAAPRLVREKV